MDLTNLSRLSSVNLSYISNIISQTGTKKTVLVVKSMSEALRQLIEDLDLDIDLDDDDEIEEIDLADKDLETVPDCIFELKDCTTLALESKFF